MSENLLFQLSTDYRAARKSLVFSSVVGGMLIGSPFFGLMAVSIPLGIVFPLIVYSIACMRIAVMWEKSLSYIVTESRASVRTKEETFAYSLDSIFNVKLKRTLSSNDRSVSTITFRAKNAKGKVKTVKFKYIFRAEECYKYLLSRAESNAVENNNE